jgi:DNA repair exonuclease SbcCD ATPase subunit
MKIDVSVSIDGKDRPLGLYSGGQFRRIALAVDLALSDITCARNSNKLNLMILDEYCKDLSEVSMEKVLKLLQSRKGSTILIEHNSIFKSIVNNVFEVELINKVSRRVE